MRYGLPWKKAMIVTAEIAGEIVPSAMEGDGLSALARAAVDAGMPENTRQNYRRGWADFVRWCEIENRCPLPATSETLTEYATWLCYLRPLTGNNGHRVPGRLGLSPRSAETALWAVAKAHELVELPAPGRSGVVRVLNGYRKKLADDRDPRAKTKKAKATTREDLPRLVQEGAGRSANPFIALRDQALLYVNYVCAARVSELVRLNIEDVQEVPQGLLISVYRQKTRSQEEVAVPEADSPQAVTAIRGWITVLAENGFRQGPLFPCVTKSGTIGLTVRYGPRGKAATQEPSDGRMSIRTIQKRIEYAAELAGMEHRTPHSQRRGFATSAHNAGHAVLDIGRHGGWADGSHALLGYIEEAMKWSRNPLKGAGV